jgi:hypothetical protein
MIQSEIRERIAAMIDDPDNVFVSEAQLNTSIDEGMEMVAEATGCIRRTAFCSIREGATYYFTNSIASDMMYPYRIWNESNNRRLTATSLDELDAYSRTWLTTSGNPESWFPVSWDYFGVYPHAVDAGGVLRIDYLAWPRALNNDDEEPEIPEASMNALVTFGAWEGQLKQWDEMTAYALYDLFQKETGQSRDRTGMGRVQERSFGRGGLNLPSQLKEGGIF